MDSTRERSRFTHPRDAKPGHRWVTVGGKRVSELVYLRTTNVGTPPLVGVVAGEAIFWYTDGRTGGGRSDLDLVDDV